VEEFEESGDDEDSVLVKGLRHVSSQLRNTFATKLAEKELNQKFMHEQIYT